LLLSSQDGFFAKLLATVAHFFLLISLTTSSVRAEESLEYKIKAAYLYNFTKFISWPETTAATFNICVVGDDPFNDLLNGLESKNALGKPIRILRYSSLGEVKNCQIVYFDNTDRLPNIVLPNALLVGNLNDSLTVSSQPFFAESGGMIGFVLEEEKVKLHINLKALKQGGLGISAKLIEVSTLVGED
jgi:YfiR/HmsC-like